MSDAPHTMRPGRGMRIALILSLGLNLLILGALAGLLIVGAERRSDGALPGLRAVGLGPILPALSQDDRRELGARLRDNRDRLAADGRPLGRAVREFADALRSEPFDRAAAEAALTAQRNHGMSLQEHGHGLLLDQIETMDAEARAELAGRIERSLRRALERRFEAGQSPRDAE